MMWLKIENGKDRSPSPAEERQDSPAPVLVENEPEIDDSALILSWCTFVYKQNKLDFVLLRNEIEQMQSNISL